MALFAKSGASAKDKITKDAERAEIKLCAMLSEHNIPFLAMDHIVDVLKSSFPDSKVSF